MDHHRRLKPTLVLALLLLTAPVLAHAPEPKDYDLRLERDCIDDNQDGAFGQDGYDLHALDLHEAWTPDGGDHMVWRIALDGEGPGTIRIEANGAPVVTLSTQDGDRWTSNVGDVTRPEIAASHGTYVLDAWIPWSEHGLGVGSTISDWSATSRVDDRVVDSMPGNDAFGPCDEGSSRSEPTLLRGTQRYFDVVLDSNSARLGPGDEARVEAVVTSQVGSDQLLWLHVEGIDDGDWTWVGPNGQPTDARVVSAGSDLRFDLLFRNAGNQSQDAALHFWSQQGGHQEIPFFIRPPAAADPEPSKDDGPTDTQPAPAPTVLVGLALVAWAARRRS